MNLVRKTVLLFVVLLPLSLFAEQDFNKDELVKFEVTSFKKDMNNYLALTFQNMDEWHTYWKNPGDAGTPLEINFLKDGKKLKLTELEWPTPIRYLQAGGLWGYGYIDKYTFFFEIPKNLESFLLNSQVVVKVTWLACKNICVPGSEERTLTFDQNLVITNEQKEFKVDLDYLINSFNAIPSKTEFPSNLDITLVKDKNTSTGLVLYYSFTGPVNFIPPENQNLIFPIPLEPLTFKHEEIFKDKKGNLYGRMFLDWDGEYLEPPITLSSDGKFDKSYLLNFLFFNPASGKTILIEKNFEQFDLNAEANLNNFFKLLTKIDIPNLNANIEIKHNITPSNKLKTLKIETKSPNYSSIWYYLILAFLGGLILNIMPCVLPIISIKLFSLIKSQEKSKAEIFKHNMFYTLGVLISFLALALVLALLKVSSEGVGWGFQLQSPTFIVIMIIVIFIFALNLFGLFEFITPGGASLGNYKIKEGALSDFLNGILATILATPCSAPFLGVALTFAFASSTSVLVFVFLTVGLGMASPFIITGIFPNLISFLPKPGKWMENIKKFLGLTLLLTCIWLIDVFMSQVDQTTLLLKLNIILTFFFFYFLVRKQITTSFKIRSLFFLIPIVLLLQLVFVDLKNIDNTSSVNTDNNIIYKMNLKWTKWSPQILEELKEKKKLVFIDFTAKWCFTCKFNEKLVLETTDFKNIIEKYQVTLLLADWTKRDPIIGNWLNKNGVVGVPAYFIQKENGELINLGETISINEIENHLK